jgi:alanine-glyoxylate transaminase/serine-glyoxylate transaminase/serine-pyruvate transaminase
MLRPVFQNKNPTAQPFVISGSGTLGMDMVAASLVEPDDQVLVLSAGTFGQNFSRCLKAYRADVTLLEVDRPGGGFTSHHIEKALQEHGTEYAMVVVTHVETSTGVRNDVAAIANCVRQLLPSAIIVVDAVCSLGVEDLRFDDWDLDVVISCSQKGLGCPAGLSIMMLSSRALLKLESRAAPISGFYSSLSNWLPSKLIPYLDL